MIGLPIGPGMVRLSEPVLDSVFLTCARDDMRAGQPRAAFELGKLHAAITQDSVDILGHGPDQRSKGYTLRADPD